MTGQSLISITDLIIDQSRGEFPQKNNVIALSLFTCRGDWLGFSPTSSSCSSSGLAIKYININNRWEWPAFIHRIFTINGIIIIIIDWILETRTGSEIEIVHLTKVSVWPRGTRAYVTRPKKNKWINEWMTVEQCPTVFSGPKNKKKFLKPLPIKFNVPFTDLVPDQVKCLSISSQSNDVIRGSI